jgi:hypothetical protein
VVRSEVNFLVYPFFCLDNRWHTERLKIEYHRTIDRGDGREDISWRVLAHQEYGLPGLFDWALHQAIEEIINEQGFPVCNPVPFGMRDVCRRMEITYSGRTAEDIKAAFLRMISALVESKRTFYSKPKKQWIEDHFHLYDRVVYRGDELPDGGGVADTNYLYLGSWYLDNLNALYVTLLDTRYRRSLSSTLARRLYEIFGVKFYGLRAAQAPFLRYPYSTLCALLPVKRYRYRSDAQRQLEAAHQELIATGFLERVEWYPTPGRPPEWYVHYFPGPRAQTTATALPAPRNESLALDLQDDGSTAEMPLATRAQDLLQHFRQGLVAQPPRHPHAKELQQAEALLREHGDERARAIVTYALREAARTDFHMQHFGAVLGYQEMALAALAQQAQQTQELAALRQRQIIEQQEMEAERAQEDRAAAVLAALPEAQRAAYRHRALAQLPPGMRDMDGLVARYMRHLVIEEGLVALE